MEQTSTALALRVPLHQHGQLGTLVTVIEGDDSVSVGIVGAEIHFAVTNCVHHSLHGSWEVAATRVDVNISLVFSLIDINVIYDICLGDPSLHHIFFEAGALQPPPHWSIL